MPPKRRPYPTGRERFQQGSDYYPDYPYSVGVYKASEQYPVPTVVEPVEKQKNPPTAQQKAKIGAFDMKEMLKQEMFQSRSRGCDDHLAP